MDRSREENNASRATIGPGRDSERVKARRPKKKKRNEKYMARGLHMCCNSDHTRQHVHCGELRAVEQLEQQLGQTSADGRGVRHVQVVAQGRRHRG